MKPGRFIVETHCHAQRHAARIQAADEEADYADLAGKMGTAVPADEATDDDAVIVYDNSDRVLHDMEAYGVDRCVLLPGFGMTNEINRQIIAEHPETFVAAAAPVQTKKAAQRGEEPWTWDAACEELDEWLAEDGFRMIGEGVPYDPMRTEPIPWPERKDEVRRVFDVAADHDVPVRWHTGYVSGYGAGSTSLFDLFPDWSDPTLAGQLKAEYPEVPVIFDHGGMAATWRERHVDQCCQVAATHDEVYLEIGLYWADLLRKPMNDPNIATEQLLWGNDWGASMPQYHQPGEEPQTYWDQIADWGLPAHQVDYWGASLRQLVKYAMAVDLPQDDLNLVLGGNAARLFDLEVPETRLFPEYLEV